MDLFKLVGTIAINNDEANKALDDTSKKGEQSESKLKGAFSKIGSGAAKVGKAVVSGMAVAGTGVAALTTKAIQSYADYEQLVGGIETLFKDSAMKVQGYADRAYLTAGMSANEYMETVTGFSASLLQSLGNDTEKAAEKADMALSDMSDNANKMGTDMELIKNAYQGFAKQNYTMLDNLKLGYGGTKEEMQRLLKDAQKFSGIKYDISSYADVVDAIHVIQNEMGITGTTAKEASTTISGSISSMKAQWNNLITAMSQGDGWDLGVYVSNFVDTVATVVTNLLPVISSSLDGIVMLIQQLAPVIIAEIPNLLSTLLPAVISAATGLLDAIAGVLPSLVTVLVESAPVFIEGFVQVFNALVEALPSLVEALVSALPTLIPAIIDGIVEMIVMLCTMLPQIIQPIIDYLPEIIVAIVDALLQNLPALIMGVGQLILGLAQAIPQLWGALVEASKGIFTTLLAKFAEWFQPITDWFKSAWEKFTGIVSGVWETIKKVISTAFKLIGSIIDAAFQIITLPFRFIWENCKEYVFAAFEWIKSKIKIAVDFIKNIIHIGFAFVQEKIITPITNAKNKVVEVFNNIKSAIQEKITAAKNKVSEIFNNIKSSITEKINSIKSSVTSKFNEIKEKITSPITKAKDKVKEIVDKIKGFFSGLKLKFPNVKLPHFSIKPKGWKIGDLLEGEIPKLGIDWYAKAVNAPKLLTDTTAFGYNPATGNVRVGGETSDEIVGGAGTIMGMIRSAVASEMGGTAYYLKQIIVILADYFPQILEGLDKDMYLDGDMLVGGTAQRMNNALGIIARKKERGGT